MQPPTTLRRATRAALGTLAALATACLVLVAAPGWAHVEIDPGTATQGEEAALSFRVPNESDSATTTRIQIYLPTDHPLAEANVRPHPGWHARVQTGKLDQPLTTDDGEVSEAVIRITWTADSARDALKPGQYDDFDIAVGPLPEVSSLTFKVLQTYSDGSVVRWIDPPVAEGEPEPEHPAPTLTLVPASYDAADTSASETDEADEDGDTDGTATTALVLSIVAVLLGAGALGASLLRRRT
jgi:periplasmic copper chaperone A